MQVDPDEKLEAVACIPHHVPVFFTIKGLIVLHIICTGSVISILFSQTECPPGAPTKISVNVIHFNDNNFIANISWDAATFFGNISRYVVYVSRKGQELLANDTEADVDSDSSFRTVSMLTEVLCMFPSTSRGSIRLLSKPATELPMS